MADILDLSAHFPELEFAPGEAIVEEGGASAGIWVLVAVGLAERLNFVTTYLADRNHQYSDAPGLSMVSDVLTRLAQRTGPVARPGSAREPDPAY
jgi:hypothetical protein